nr:unnamed protein product [Digitaria exilis]
MVQRWASSWASSWMKKVDSRKKKLDSASTARNQQRSSLLAVRVLPCGEGRPKLLLTVTDRGGGTRPRWPRRETGQETHARARRCCWRLELAVCSTRWQRLVQVAAVGAGAPADMAELEQQGTTARRGEARRRSSSLSPTSSGDSELLPPAGEGLLLLEPAMGAAAGRAWCGPTSV